MDINKRQQAEAQRGVVWLEKHWKGRKTCPICGNNDWDIGVVSELRTFTGGNLVIGGPGNSVMPLLPVSCSVCGLTYTFSAIRAGIVHMDEYREDES